MKVYYIEVDEDIDSPGAEGMPYTLGRAYTSKKKAFKAARNVRKRHVIPCVVYVFRLKV